MGLNFLVKGSSTFIDYDLLEKSLSLNSDFLGKLDMRKGEDSSSDFWEFITSSSSLITSKKPDYLLDLEWD